LYYSLSHSLSLSIFFSLSLYFSLFLSLRTFSFSYEFLIIILQIISFSFYLRILTKKEKQMSGDRSETETESVNTGSLRNKTDAIPNSILSVPLSHYNYMQQSQSQAHNQPHIQCDLQPDHEDRGSLEHQLNKNNTALDPQMNPSSFLLSLVALAAEQDSVARPNNEGQASNLENTEPVDMDQSSEDQHKCDVNGEEKPLNNSRYQDVEMADSSEIPQGSSLVAADPSPTHQNGPAPVLAPVPSIAFRTNQHPSKRARLSLDSRRDIIMNDDSSPEDQEAETRSGDVQEVAIADTNSIKAVKPGRVKHLTAASSTRRSGRRHTLPNRNYSLRPQSTIIKPYVLSHSKNILF
jgi:hypothetical protein